jgi:hypothetical protein
MPLQEGSTEKDHIEIIEAWPIPSSVPEPKLWNDERCLSLRYHTADDRLAVLQFDRCLAVKAGPPNDEALHGHPLYSRGLRFYSVHRVSASSWIDELERMNRVHPRHDRDHFIHGLSHYIFTFQDSTLECIVRDGAGTVSPNIRLFSSPRDTAYLEFLETIAR